MKVLSVNISEAKGTVKTPVDSISLDATGVAGDAHAGNWHRQVSMLGKESFDKFGAAAGRELAWGEFGENITTEGLLLYECRPFDRFEIGETVLEVTQIGKKCHGEGCAIFQEVGNCVMPKEGIFCRVIRGGEVRPGDRFFYHPKVMKVLVITLSDRAYEGIYADRSGPRIAERTEACFGKKGWPTDVTLQCIPDDAVRLDALLVEASGRYDLIFTTGGTGLGPRDITVDTLKKHLRIEIPGVMDYIRLTAGAVNPNALISRSVAGLIGNTPLFALPGSVKAVNEYMDTIEKVLEHLIFTIQGIDTH